MEEQDILDRWTKYIGDLFEDSGDMLDFDENKELLSVVIIVLSAS